MEKLKCVINRDSDVGAFLHVKNMVEDLYSNDTKYSNSIVILGYNLGKSIDYYRKNFPGKKIIVYQLEQLYNYNPNWFNPKSRFKNVVNRTNHIKNWLDNCDEIWDYDLNNKWFLEQLGYNKVRFMPLKYSESLKNLEKNDNPKYDILFYGSINKKRFDILKRLHSKFNLVIVGDYYDVSEEEKNKVKLNIIPKNFGETLDSLISNSKIILNLHFYESLIQEQVRLFYLVTNNKCVVSEKSKKNYYGDLIHEFDNYTELEKTIIGLLKDKKWYEVSKNISDKFKNKEFNNIRVGAVYNSFYNVDVLKKSIESIINVVDYICVVHQKKSFSGEIGTKENEQLLNDLVQCHYINELVYYDKESSDKIQGMIDKRNLGLEKCREKKCDYIITLDNDECYNDRRVREEVMSMAKNNLDTLYSPIISYYKNDKYYFLEEKLYVPSIYKINDRKYERGIHSSVLSDPARKMKERKFRVSQMYMHHLTYLENNFKEKINSKILFSVDKTKKNFSVEILNFLQSWKHGNDGLVIGSNDKNESVLIKKQLLFLDKLVNDFDNENFEKQISIIIPTYNNTDFIIECLDSVINSIKGLSCEVLVGIDGCKKTLDFIKGKSFDSRISFYFFEENVGPYIIKNTLVTKSNSKNILFFDSDDIMMENLISETIQVLSTRKMFKPKYFDFKNKNEISQINKLTSNKFGEGVFAIDKTTFMSLNGFEGWRCAADSDFMGRFYKRNIPLSHGQKISFFRRIHEKSLTNSPETNMSSKLRAHYVGLSKTNRPNGKCLEFKTAEFICLSTQTFKANSEIIKNKPESDIKSSDILKKIRGTNPQQTNSNGVDYDKLNKILYSQGVYDPKKNTDKPKIVQNKPIDRNKLIEIKKGSNLDALKKNLPGKPDRRKNTQNIFSKKNSR